MNITDAYYADDLAILSKIIHGASKLLHSSISRRYLSIINAKKTTFMQFNCNGTIKKNANHPLESVDDFTYLGSNIRYTETDVSVKIGKA